MGGGQIWCFFGHLNLVIDEEQVESFNGWNLTIKIAKSDCLYKMLECNLTTPHQRMFSTTYRVGRWSIDQHFIWLFLAKFAFGFFFQKNGDTFFSSNSSCFIDGFTFVNWNKTGSADWRIPLHIGYLWFPPRNWR